MGILGRLLAFLSHNRLMVSENVHITDECTLSWVDEWSYLYCSDLPDAEWAVIEPELVAWCAPRLEREVSSSRAVRDPREIVNAILLSTPGEN